MDNVKYNKLIESIEIKKIELLSLKCHQNTNFESKKKSNVDIGISSDVEEFYMKGLDLYVYFNFEITAFHNNDYDQKDELTSENINPEDVLFNISFVLKLKYSLELDDVKDIMIELEKEINLFIEKNVPINAWPYARETISSITTRMGFPALVIPPFKSIPLN